MNEKNVLAMVLRNIARAAYNPAEQKRCPYLHTVTVEIESGEVVRVDGKQTGVPQYSCGDTSYSCVVGDCKQESGHNPPDCFMRPQLDGLFSKKGVPEDDSELVDMVNENAPELVVGIKMEIRRIRELSIHTYDLHPFYKGVDSVS